MNIHLRADDGHEFGAYVARPKGTVTEALVVIQEIFGVNSHIRSVADGFARDGFFTIAPALFDRAERGAELAYTPEDTQRGIAIRNKVGTEDALLDIAAAIEFGKKETSRVAVVGYCWGGTLAWLAATRLEPAVAVGYYGGHVADYANEKLHCPVMLHFGAKDAHIPPGEIDKVRRAHPEVPIYVYDAGHGFNCDQRKDYDAKSAASARERTLEFLKKSLK